MKKSLMVLSALLVSSTVFAGGKCPTVEQVINSLQQLTAADLRIPEGSHIPGDPQPGYLLFGQTSNPNTDMSVDGQQFHLQGKVWDNITYESFDREVAYESLTGLTAADLSQPASWHYGDDPACTYRNDMKLPAIPSEDTDPGTVFQGRGLHIYAVNFA